MSAKTSYTEINRCELKELITRVEHAIEHELSLDIADLKQLLAAITTLLELQDRMEEDDATLYKLRKLLGIVKQSETRRSPNKKSKGKKNKLPRKRRKKQPPTIKHHELTKYHKGDVCPCCKRGKLYKNKPQELLRITGHAPFERTKHVAESLHCNACQHTVNAELPEDVLADGDEHQMYGYSARSIMAIHKFYSGLPYYHQENLSDILGMTVPSSTIYDQCSYVSYDIAPVVAELKNIAAEADNFDIDDTHNRILEQQPELKDKRNGSGKQLRSGVYTSGLIATLPDEKEIILYETSLGHAGEHLDSILGKRQSNSIPSVMCDALSSNSSSYQVLYSYCNAHSRRQFVDIENNYPEQVRFVLDKYALIWQNETLIEKQEMSADERLFYHQEQSLPVMVELKEWAESLMLQEDFEEHNAFAKAIKYFVKHFEKLTAFCRIKGAKIDNNRMEERLKLIIRGRKTAHFFRTKAGAEISNNISSLIATAEVNNVDIFDYLTTLQRNRLLVRQNPTEWLPWNYLETLASMNKALAPDKAA